MTLDLYGHADGELGRAVRYSVSNLAAAQARMGDEPTIHLLTSGRGTQVVFDGVRAHFHRCVQPPAKLGRFARQFSRSMVRAIEHGSADIVHFHGVRQFHLMFAAIAFRCGRERLPLIGQERGYRKVGRLEGSAQRYALRRCQATVAASAEGVGAAIALGVPPVLVSVLPNGFDPEIFSAGDPCEPGSPDRPLRILVISRLTTEKDPLTMAAALAQLADRGTTAVVRIFGRGALRHDVEAELRRASIPAAFFDHVSQASLADEYRSSDVLLLTTREREGWSQSVIEAMACGLPVVASDVPGIRDAAGDAAVLVPPGNATAFADVLERLAGSCGERRRLRTAGIAHAAGFTWTAVARTLRTTYEALVSDAEGRGGSA